MSAQIRIYLFQFGWVWTNAWQSGRVNMHIRVLVLMRWKTISCVVILRLALICLETVQIVAPCLGCAPGHGLPLSLSWPIAGQYLRAKPIPRPRPAWASFQGCLLSPVLAPLLHSGPRPPLAAALWDTSGIGARCDVTNKTSEWPSW